jgi:LemA protein
MAMVTRREYILIAVILIIFLILGNIFNNIVIRYESIIASWAQVENQLERRFALITNLVNSVKGYAEHEKTLFEEIANVRSQWSNAGSAKEKINVASSADVLLSRLLMVVESYPDLKASQNFLQLMDELSGTENRIAVERMRYNEEVKSYNILVKTFPGNIIGLIFHYRPATEYFKAEEKAKGVPEVKF